MEKRAVSSLEKSTYGYLKDIEKRTWTQMNIKSDVNIFEQIAEGKILEKLLRIIDKNYILFSKKQEKNNSTNRFDYLSYILNKLKEIPVEISFITPNDILKCNERQVCNLIQAVYNYILCGINEKHFDTKMLEWINFFSAFKQNKSNEKYVSKKIYIQNPLLPNISTNDLYYTYEEIEFIKHECHNFSSDLKDGRIYALVIARAFYHHLSPVILVHIWNQKDEKKRIEYIFKLTNFLGIENILTVNDVLQGNTTKNKVFISRLYNLYMAYSTTEKIKNLEYNLKRCRTHIKELRMTIQSLSMQNSQQREVFYHEILSIQTEYRKNQSIIEYENNLQLYVIDAVKSIQNIITPGIDTEGDNFSEKMWSFYLNNLEIISSYKNKILELEVKNTELEKNNKILKDVILSYMKKKSMNKKAYIITKLFNLFSCFKKN